MNISKISMRNITRQKKRSFLLGGAIAFGVFIIITIGSFTAGMTETLKENFTSIMGGHIYILGTETLDSGRIVQVIGDTADLERAIDTVDDLVKEYHVRSQVRMGEIIFGSKSTTLQVSGIDWNKEQLLKDTLTIADGSLENIEKAGSLIIPEKVADKLGVIPGETVLIRMDTVTGQKNVGEFTVAAIVQEQDSFSFISAGYTEMGYLNDLIGLESDEYQYLNLHLKDIAQMDIVAEKLVTELEKTSLVDAGDDEDEDGEEDQRHGMMFGGGMTSASDEPWDGTKFSITNLNDIMEPVLQLVNILNIVSLALFVILMIITMVGLINTFRMVLIERTKEIGTMRAIGMHRGSVRSIFLLEALYLALFGAAGGIILSFATTIITGLIRFTADSALGLFLHSGRLQFITTPVSVLQVVFLLAVMTLIAVYLPAKKAAKLKVVDALRAQY
ncbi:MAG: ABC transporter permease [Spirochaetia bacterium]|jgi:putative ABC transport system permease protein|nr:ABC transporter permease [Spirochaetia bacterium]